ncbi:CoA transferase [Streptomonospora wellingtoniae]|uniref:CoA transferase n=1 Tax=Streptomonospora wellingtoniae TaxID=3075544 RepID=A0ABU2KQ64_9ACTN|nr:CoA transferase [Streptomonospora sp. DSM 45055]MDT0301411.1 CoA transferase [Streptomonospora sp. DSM 45055]
MTLPSAGIAAGGTAAPLAGLTAERAGDSAAARVAEDHLRLLGAGSDAEPGGAPPEDAPAEASAGRLVLGVPGGRIACGIDWAGPLGIPLGDETAVQAACGIMHVHGRAAGEPRPLGLDYASAVGGVLAVHGLLAAAVGRLRGLDTTGVRTSVAQAALLSVGQYLAAATAPEAGRPEESRSDGPPFVSADGVRFEIETFAPETWQRFWSLLGADRGALARGWRPFLHRFATAVCPLPPELHGTVAAHSFREVAGAGRAAGISIVRVRAAGPPAAARTDRAPWRLSAAARSGTPEPVHRPCGAGAAGPLEGLVVVESARRVQGPLAGHVLRLLGAEVVRIEPPGGDPLRWMPPTVGACSARFLALNRGKRVVEIDIKSPAGRREVCELVAGADVFLHNWAPGKAAAFGLDAADLHAVRPDLVYACASGWGRAEGAGAAMSGAEPLGTDFLVQAHSGVGALVHPQGAPPAPSLMTLTDVLGGLVSAEGVLAGLLARCRGAGGSRVDSSLYDAATVLTGSAAAVGGGAIGGSRPARRSLRGPLDEPLPAGDGRLALGPRSRGAPDQVARALGAAVQGGDVRAGLAARCRASPAAELAGRLRAGGLDATPVCTDLAELAADPRFGAAVEGAGAAFVRSPWEFSP